MGVKPSGGSRAADTLGFLTVVEHELTGLIGGYLILNTAGRPVEFHCTAPVKPSRAQQILFGPTLAPYLYGEQIAQALIAKVSAPSPLIFTDQPPVLSVRDCVAHTIVLLMANTESDGELRRIADPSQHFDTLVEFSLNKHRVAVPAAHEGDRLIVIERMTALANLDLQEPFGRIREALDEAQRAATGRPQAA